MEQTHEKLKEAFRKIEEATKLYQQIMQKMNETDQSTIRSSIKSMRVLVNEKKLSLDPTIKFEDIQDNSIVHPSIPPGHMITTFYHRNPNQSNTTYQTEPISLKPWLACRI